MPRKLHHYVPKNASRKGKKNIPKLSNLIAVAVNNVLSSGKVVGARPASTVSVSVQTDLQFSILPNNIHIAVQMENFTIHCERKVSVQTEILETVNEIEEMIVHYVKEMRNLSHWLSSIKGYSKMLLVID